LPSIQGINQPDKPPFHRQPENNYPKTQRRISLLRLTRHNCLIGSQRVVAVFLFPPRYASLYPVLVFHPTNTQTRTSPSSSPPFTMSVAYEPRSFMHEGAYPPIGEEHDHTADQRFSDTDVAEQLSQYTAEATMLPDDRGVLEDDTRMLTEDVVNEQDPTRLDLTSAEFPSPIQVPLPTPQISESIPDHELKEPSPGIDSPASPRSKQIPKPNRDVIKQADGRFHCPLEDCKEDVRAFARKCEWNKHMDKHERPYRCPADGCENLPGFTYSGGLLRHEREVHGKHGGPKKTVNCPHPNCKRHTGKGFSRQENLNEHLRRVHTNIEATSPPAEANSPDDNESEKSAMKRKRRSSTDHVSSELTELRDEITRLKEENEKLRTQMEQQTAEMQQQSQHSLAMMAQIADLQDALRHGMNTHALGAPTAQMI
jgi:hypothetical protein